MVKLTGWGRVKWINPEVSVPEELGRIEFSPDTESLAVGLHRSYGDSCLLEPGRMIVMKNLRNIISFDTEQGIIKAESGVTIAELLEVVIPHGWFLPVIPGTGHVTLGGAVANDIHGKNHYHAGSFGNHVKSLELLRSDDGDIICSEKENNALFKATIGGLGLTGIIKSVEIGLIRISSTNMLVEEIKFANLDEFFHIADESDGEWPYTVAWVDCFAKGEVMGRGIFSRAKFTADGILEYKTVKPLISLPFDMPGFFRAGFLINLFNRFYYWRLREKRKSHIADYSRFFFPLDKVKDWNKYYGSNGFFQYHLVIPGTDRAVVMAEIMEAISNSGHGAFLAVLKTFGKIKSKGLLTFPMDGVTLALDFPNKPGIEELFLKLDGIVLRAGGRLYPAKDGRMGADIFQKMYHSWEKVESMRDKAINSLFWKRVSKK